MGLGINQSEIFVPFPAERMHAWSRTLSFCGLPPARPRARAAFKPASVRLRMTLPSNSAFCSSPQMLICGSLGYAES